LPTMYPCALGLLGAAMALNGQAPQALSVIETALHERSYAAAGSYAELLLRLSLGMALMYCGRYADAVAAARRAVEFATQDQQNGHKADAIFWYAEALVAAGCPEQALLRFDEACTAANECAMRFLVLRAQTRMTQVSAGLRLSTNGASLGGS
jgi:tetratricopeptide (TPR) repeat protein